MHKVFEVPVLIRFAHCDPAGIVFHPQYFTIFNGVVEDFFREVVHIPFLELFRHGVALPVAGIRCDFVNPSRPGDECVARLWIEHLGKSSIRLAMVLVCAGRLREGRRGAVPERNSAPASRDDAALYGRRERRALEAEGLNEGLGLKPRPVGGARFPVIEETCREVS